MLAIMGISFIAVSVWLYLFVGLAIWNGTGVGNKFLTVAGWPILILVLMWRGE